MISRSVYRRLNTTIPKTESDVNLILAREKNSIRRHSRLMLKKSTGVQEKRLVDKGTSTRACPSARTLHPALRQK